MSVATQTADALSEFPQRGAGTDAERRAAVWLGRQITQTGGRRAEVETFWCRPNWAMAQAWHAGLGLAGSLLAVPSPKLGAALLAAAVLCVLADAWFSVSPGRLLIPQHASQNVVSRPPDEARPDPGASDSGRVRLIITANLDTGRDGLVYREALRRTCARARARTGGVAPGWTGWLALALVWALATALLRVEGEKGTALSVAQLVPTVGVLLALALLLELAGSAWVPGAGDNGSGVAVAVALTRALDAAPPGMMDVELVLTGAADGQILGLRRHLRAHRRGRRPANTVVLGIGASGAGEPVWLHSDGSLIPLGYSHVLRDLCREVQEIDPGLGLHEVRGRGSAPALAARLAGLPAISLGARDADGLIPRSHRPEDTADRLAPAAIQSVLRAALLLVDSLDAHLSRRPPQPAR